MLLFFIRLKNMKGKTDSYKASKLLLQTTVDLESEEDLRMMEIQGRYLWNNIFDNDLNKHSKLSILKILFSFNLLYKIFYRWYFINNCPGPRCKKDFTRVSKILQCWRIWKTWQIGGAGISGCNLQTLSTRGYC